MKFSATPYFVLAAVTGSLVSGAAVQPTAAPLVERQFPTDPAQLSAVFGNPSSALAAVSSLLTIPAVSSAFRSIATDPVYISQISEQLVGQFGTASGQAALQSYEAAVNSLLGGNAIQTSAPAQATQTSSTGSSGAAGSGAPASSNSAASGGGSTTTSGSNAAGSLFTVTAMGTAIVAGAVFVAAAL